MIVEETNPTCPTGQAYIAPIFNLTLPRFLRSPWWLFVTSLHSLARDTTRLLVLGLVAVPALAPAAELDLDITETTIEQLMNVSVTTVSRQQEELQTSAAAAYVLSREDIRRAHVTSVPEALRLVPGVQVARIDANKWAVSIRGFNARTANKLLVLIDGRSVYDPLFSGVFWEARDVALEEIERIEVVRGPGGTLWGANAVNGVINIITRNARDTQGTQATIGAGTEERAMASVRHGWQPTRDSYARVYADGLERDRGHSPTVAHDDSHMGRAGLRVDWDASTADQVMLKVDLFDGSFGSALSGGGSQDVKHQGQSVVGRWTRDRGDGSQTTLQLWYDGFSFDDVNLGEERDTFDIDFQHAFHAGDAHRVLWGAGFRRTWDDIRDGPVLSVVPTSRRDDLLSLFFQDEIGLVDDRARLTLGAKVEHNDYSGTELQPSARIAWVPNANNTVWGAVSRAVRSPSRLESDVVSPVIAGNPDFDSETLIAYETGFRRRISPQAWVDAAAFYNVYRKLRSIENGIVDNKLRGTTSGVEVAGRWRVSSAWRLDLAYTYLDVDIETAAGGTDVAGAATLEGSDPRHQLMLRSAWNPFSNVEVDATLRYVDQLRALNVPSYLEADLGVGWKLRTNLELSAVAQNLLDSHHPEQSGTTTTEVERGYYLKLRWGF